MSKVLNFNVAAVALLSAGEAGLKVRVRATDTGFQVRPTDRVLVANLPKGEVLRQASAKTEAGKVRGLVLKVTDFAGAEAGVAYELSKGKYGWYNLTKVDEVAKGAAYARVAVK